MPVIEHNTSSSSNKQGTSSMSAETYKKYEKEYNNWKRTGKYSNDFNSWKNHDDIELFKKIKSGKGKSALSNGKYYYMDNDTYDKYGREYSNWKQTKQYSSNFNSWNNQKDLDAFKAIRGSRSAQDNAFDDFRYSLNDDIVKSVQDKYRSQWGDKYYYDITDMEDVARMNAGQMPKYLAEKYKNDPYDQWLYANNLPSTKDFNDMYSQAVLDYNEEQQKAAEKQQEDYGKYKAAYDSVYKYMTGMDSFTKGLASGKSMEELLATGEYDDIVGYYSAPKQEKEYTSEIEKYAAQKGESNPVYDKAYEAIIAGELPDQEFFDTYKEKDWQKYLKSKLAFTDDDLEMSRVLGAVSNSKQYGMAEGVDLMSRVPASKKELERAGWTTDDKYTTLNAQIESDIDDDGNASYAVFSTIDQEGNVLTKKEYNKYIKEYWKTGEDPRGLLLGQFADKEQAGVYADRLKAHQNAVYGLDADDFEERRAKAREDYINSIKDPVEQAHARQGYAYSRIQEINAEIESLKKERNEALLKTINRTDNDATRKILADIGKLEEEKAKLQDDIRSESRKVEQYEIENYNDAIQADNVLTQADLYAQMQDIIAQREANDADPNRSAALDEQLQAEFETVRERYEAITADVNYGDQVKRRSEAYYLVQGALGENLQSTKAVDIHDMSGMSVDAQELYWEIARLIDPESYDKYTSGGIIVNKDGQYVNEHTLSSDSMEKMLYASDAEMKTALGLMQSDPARAAEYLESLNVLLSMRANDNREDKIAELATKYPVAMSVASVPANILSGFEGIGTFVGALNGESSDVMRFNAGATMFSSTVRGTVSENISMSNQHAFAGTDITWGEVGAFLYQTGMSAMDSAARTALAAATGGAGSLGGWGGLAIMGSGVAGQTILDAMDNGATTGQAFVLGTIAGSIEILTEKISLTHFFDISTSAGYKELAKNILKQMGAEAKEEVYAEIVNSIAQLLSGWDKADLLQQAQAYMDAHPGVSHGTAIALVMSGNVITAAAGGALSGFGFGAVGSVNEVNQYAGSTFKQRMQTVGAYREGNMIDTQTYRQMTADLEQTNLSQQAKDGIVNLLDEIRLNPEIAGTNAVQAELKNVQRLLAQQNMVDVRLNNSLDRSTRSAYRTLHKAMDAIRTNQAKSQELIAAGDAAGARQLIQKTNSMIESYQEEQKDVTMRLQDAALQREQTRAKDEPKIMEAVDRLETSYREAEGSASIAEILKAKGIATDDSLINEEAARVSAVDKTAVGVVAGANEGEGLHVDPRNKATRGVRSADDVDLRLYGRTQQDLNGKLGVESVGEMTPAQSATQAEVDLANWFYDVTGMRLNLFEGNTAAGVNDGKSRIGVNRNGDIIFTGLHELIELNMDTESMGKARERLEQLPFFDEMVDRYAEAYNSRIEAAFGKDARIDPDVIKGELVQDLGALLGSNQFFDSLYDPVILFAADPSSLSPAEYMDLSEKAARMLIEISDEAINTIQHGYLNDQHNAQYYSTPEAATLEEVADSEPKAYEPGEVDEQPDNEQAGFSYVSMLQAAGLNTDKTRDFFGDYVRGNVYRTDAKGNKTTVDKVSVEDIRKSPLGAMINESYRAGYFGEIGSPEAIKNRDYQETLFSKLLSIMVSTGGTKAEQNFVMAQNFIGSALFTSMKTNSDKQYSFTHDFVSICVKTQAFIDHISEMMVHDGKSLSDTDIIAAYNKVFEANLPVSCPECYVLSRWIGIGSLLDNISRYQERFGNMTPEQVHGAYDEALAEVEAYLKENPKLENKIGKGKGALAEKYSKALSKEEEKLATAIEKGESEKKLNEMRNNIELFQRKYDQIKALAWIEKVYFGGDGHMAKTGKKGDVDVPNSKYKVPTDVLFDLNKGDRFAEEYPEAWAFRTTQGAGYGKAITPAAESVLGEDIMVIGSAGKYIQKKMDATRAGKKSINPFMDMSQMEDDGEGRLRLKENSDAAKMLKRARGKQLIQAFLGGQRWQSTSDARPEFATDYLLSALQDQVMGAMGQSYTKVESAVHALTNWGADPNMSIMPYGNGFAEDGVTPKDTAVGGMDPKKAQQLRKENERAGTITIGLNDKHIRALYNQTWRDFIIPYHASGGRAEMIASMRAIQDRDSSDKTATRSCDYTSTQGDKLLTDNALYWMYCSDSEDAQEYRKQTGITRLTEEQFREKLQLIYDTREMRKWVMTKGKSGKRHAELLDPNSERYNYILDRLYHRLNDKGSIWREMEGIPVAKFQAKDHFQIFPNEFWDQDTTYDTSYVNTQDYLNYCESLGVLHRFSGRVPRSIGEKVTALKRVNGYNEKGEKAPMTDLAYKEDGSIEGFYWKNLTDRRMYGNQGQYLDQQRMTVGTAFDNTDMYDDMLSFANVADTDASGKQVRKYRPKVSEMSAKEIANMSPEERRAVAESSAAKNIIERMVNGNKKSKAPVQISAKNAIDLTPVESAPANGNSIMDQMVSGFSMVSPVKQKLISTSDSQALSKARIDKLNELIAKKKVVLLSNQDVQNDIEYNNASKDTVKDVVNYIKGALTRNNIHGITLSVSNGIITADIHKAFIEHAARMAQHNQTDSKAFIKIKELFDNAEYMFSTNHESSHSKTAQRSEVDHWDYFLSALQFENNVYGFELQVRQMAKSSGGDYQAYNLKENTPSVYQASPPNNGGNSTYYTGATNNKPQINLNVNQNTKDNQTQEPDLGTSLTNFPTGLTAAQRAQMLKASRERVNQQQQNDLAEMIAELHREVKAGRQREETLEERIRNRDETLAQVRKNRDQKIINMQAEYRDAAAAERAEFNRKLREVKAEDAAKMRQQREAIKSRARRGKLINRIEQNVRDLYQYRTSPDLKKGKYIPDALIGIVDDMMMSIDFGSTKREGGQKVKGWRQHMQDLRTALEHYQLQRNGDIQGERYDASLVLPDGFLDLLGQAASMIGDNVHLQDYAANDQEQMDQLELIDTIVSVVKTSVRNVNQLKANKRFTTLAEAGKAFLDETEGRRTKRQAQNRVLAALDNLVSVDMMDAPSFAQRIGQAGGTFINNIMDGFFKGTQKVRAAQEYMTGAKQRAGIDNKTIREWSNEKIEYDTLGGQHMNMSRMQLMELYALSKREQAMRHILGGGIDLARNKASWDSQNTSYKLTYSDLDALFEKLTDQQKDFVDDLQTYLSTEASEWGNEVTRDLYGATFYNEEFYWPIKSTKTAVEEQAPDSTRMMNAVLNMSASKAINKLANNPIVVDDVLTTFCNHVSQMANYNGLAIPLSDALKFWNYRDRNDDGSINHNRNVRRAVINMLGNGGASWFSNFMKDVNGLSEGGTGTTIPGWLVSNMKAASVAGKLRVVIQQPTAVVRATSMINPKYFMQASGQSLKQTVQEMQDYAPIAWWKAQGNFDIGTGKSIRSIIVGDGSVKDQFTNALMTPAGAADDLGWSMIWNAAKAETKAHYPNLAGEELLQKTAERFTDVINKTQVIDTVMHRSQIMRSQDSGVKQSTAFMSEPIKTFNMLYNAAYNAASGQPGGKKQLAKTLAAVIASWAFNAAVLALHDSFRDREEGQKLEDMLAENMVSEFMSNANPINSIPYIRDIASIMQGYDSTKMDMSGIGDLIKSGQNIAKALTTGESSYTTYGLISNAVKAGSEVTGLPVAGLMSTAETIWNGVAPGTLPKYQPSSNKQLRQQMFDAGLDKENVYDLMVNGMADVAEKTGMTKTTNAVKALAVAAADSNNDGIPDFSDTEQDLIAEILGIKSYTNNPDKYGSFRNYAIQQAQDAVEKGKLSNDIFDYYMELLG